jgi:hypothetical protein
MLDHSVSLVAELQLHLAFLSTANTTSLRNVEHVKTMQYRQYVINHGSEECTATCSGKNARMEGAYSSKMSVTIYHMTAPNSRSSIFMVTI